MITKKDVTFEFPEMKPAQRIRELILYIANRLEGDRTFGRVKLAKILFFVDFTSYRWYKVPITGSAYTHWQYGPVPQGYLDILDEMETAKDIVTKLTRVIDHEQKRIVALREPNLEIFSGRDIDLVHEVIDNLTGKNATELSQLSEGIAWKLAEDNEMIPYEASLLSDEPLTQEESEHAMQLAREYGLE